MLLIILLMMFGKPEVEDDWDLLEFMDIMEV